VPAQPEVVVNPVLWHEGFVIISPFVPGGRVEGPRLERAVAALKPFGIHDVTSANLVDCNGVSVLIDFMVSPA
jgi:hypothetical protein